jgi:Phage integrase, N-terminal SAM-like domain
MTDEAMSPLRRRMIEDMTIRKFAPKTQHDYVQRVKNFVAFLRRSPDTASFEDVRRYQLHLVSSGVSVPTTRPSPYCGSFLRSHSGATLCLPSNSTSAFRAPLRKFGHKARRCRMRKQPILCIGDARLGGSDAAAGVEHAALGADHAARLAHAAHK